MVISYHLQRCLEKMQPEQVDTVKFLNFLTPKNFAVSYLKFKQSSQTLGYFVKMVQSEDPDQTAPLGAV